MSKSLIKGGTVVTAIDQMEADVLIDDGKVVALLGRERDREAAEAGHRPTKSSMQRGNW